MEIVYSRLFCTAPLQIQIPMQTLDREVIRRVRRRKNLYRRVTVAMVMRSRYEYWVKWRENYVATLPVWGLGMRLHFPRDQNPNRLLSPDPQRAIIHSTRGGGKERTYTNAWGKGKASKLTAHIWRHTSSILWRSAMNSNKIDEKEESFLDDLKVAIVSMAPKWAMVLWPGLGCCFECGTQTASSCSKQLFITAHQFFDSLCIEFIHSFL